MDKFLVITFDTEDKAYEGTKALRALSDEGNIALYAAAVVAKDADGKMTVKQAADEGPMGTAVGMLVGAMVGIIGGPVGMAVGMTTGAMFGSIDDLNNIGIDGEFLREVDAGLGSGKAAVVAECAETWTTPLDARMDEIGGTVLRRARIDFTDELIDRDIAQTRADLAALQAEYDQASDEAKAKLQAKMDATKARLQASVDRAQARAETLKSEMAAKVDALEDTVSKAKGDAKSKFQESVGELKADHEARMDKLKASWEKAKASLG